jgi:hypothetical protein
MWSIAMTIPYRAAPAVGEVLRTAERYRGGGSSARKVARREGGSTKSFASYVTMQSSEFAIVYSVVGVIIAKRAVFAEARNPESYQISVLDATSVLIERCVGRGTA